MTPKLFISYSWSSQSHEDRVLQFATELRGSGVDVTLDKWDLKDGHDAHAFMEQMVADPDMKVGIVCDKAYVEKANGRKGGVGVETQIITPEIYSKVDQSKFVAIVFERDDNGRIIVPIYYKSRKYIDMSDPIAYSDGFEAVLRWVFDKPFYRKPDIGEIPKFLSGDNVFPILNTALVYNRANEAIRNDRGNKFAAIREYFDKFTSELEKFRIEYNRDDINKFDDIVIQNLSEFIPYRNEAIEVFSMISKYSEDGQFETELRRFFEGMLGYGMHPVRSGPYRDWDIDNFRFIIYELYMYCLASLVDSERFLTAERLMDGFFVEARNERGLDAVVSFREFQCQLESLDSRNKRLQMRRISIKADLMKERCVGVPVKFSDLMQIDWILFLRATSLGSWWYPELLVYASRSRQPFAVMARCRSRRYFDRARHIFAIKSKEELETLIATMKSNSQMLPRFDGWPLEISKLADVGEIETIP